MGLSLTLLHKVEHGTPARRLALSAEGRFAASLDGRGVLRVWQTAEAGPILRVVASKARVTAIAFADDEVLLVGDADGRVRAVDAASGAARWDLRRHEGAVRALGILGKELLSVGADGRLAVGDPTTEKPRVTLKRVKPFTSLAVAPNGLVALGSEGQSLVVVRLDGARAEEIWRDSSTWAPADDVHFVDGGQTLLATKKTLEILWDTRRRGTPFASGDSYAVLAASDPRRGRFLLARNTEAVVKVLSDAPTPTIEGETRDAIVRSIQENLVALRATEPQTIGRVKTGAKVTAIALAGDSVLVGTTEGEVLVSAFQSAALEPPAYGNLLDAVLAKPPFERDFPELRRRTREAPGPTREAAMQAALARVAQGKLETGIRALRLFDDPRAHAALLAHVVHKNPAVRESVVRALGDARTDAALEALLRALDDPSRDVVLGAVTALEAHASPRATTPLIDLLSRWRTTRGADMRTLFRALAASGPEDPATVKALVTFLAPPSTDRQQHELEEAAAVLARLGAIAAPALPMAETMVVAKSRRLEMVGRMLLVAITKDADAHLPALVEAFFAGGADEANARRAILVLEASGVDVERYVRAREATWNERTRSKAELLLYDVGEWRDGR